jgi:hypothetical protein
MGIRVVWFRQNASMAVTGNGVVVTGAGPPRPMPSGAVRVDGGEGDVAPDPAQEDGGHSRPPGLASVHRPKWPSSHRPKWSRCASDCALRMNFDEHRFPMPSNWYCIVRSCCAKGQSRRHLGWSARPMQFSGAAGGIRPFRRSHIGHTSWPQSPPMPASLKKAQWNGGRNDRCRTDSVYPRMPSVAPDCRPGRGFHIRRVGHSRRSLEVANVVVGQ